MKTKNLVKVLLLVMSLVAMSVAIIGCGSDDDDEVPVKKASIVGKWVFEKGITNGKTWLPTNACPAKKDYCEYFANGTLRWFAYDSDCGKVALDLKTWTIDGNTLIESKDDYTDIYTIKTLTESSMVLHWEKEYIGGKEILPDYYEDGKRDDITLYYRRIK